MQLETYSKIEPVFDMIRKLEASGHLTELDAVTCYSQLEGATKSIGLLKLDWGLEIKNTDNENFDIEKDGKDELYMIILSIKRFAGETTIPLFHKAWR